mmetsp:Transcript_60927/g.193267  ORF Transcript_60927/g.193267 Transcript_60927/m.193267 type:complete len:478 (+) Transcript_60927:43-1476(+)
MAAALSSPRAPALRARPGRWQASARDGGIGRRSVVQGGATAAALGGFEINNPFGGADKAARATTKGYTPAGPTGETLEIVDGMRQRRLGGTDIVVSELGLGTQRWGSADYNGPDEALCHAFLDRAVLEGGVNLVDTAEQYPIPSDSRRPEGRTEEIIGSWMAKDAGRREKLVISTKITGGSNVTARNIKKDCEGSLKRLGTDYLDVYLLHWPARYSPQSNWGQSLQYHLETEQAPYYKNAAPFEEIAAAMGDLIAAGKIRGWGMCNDNAYGMTASCWAAKGLGVPPVTSMQGDFSLINRRSEENGLSEGSSPVNENVGFMAYNVLAGGVLTGKYLKDGKKDMGAVGKVEAARRGAMPRGRFDDYSWGRTLYRYRSGAATEATQAYADLASEYGLPLAEMALRWGRQRDFVTTQLLGHTSMDQLEDSLSWFRTDDALPPELMASIDRVHMRNRLPIFSSERLGEDWDGFSGEIGERVP